MGWRPTGNDNQQHALVGKSQENHQHRNDYYVVAKRKGAKWFVGAITGSKPQDITIRLDFLNQPTTLTSFSDGRNAHRIAVDYKKQVQQVTPSTQLTLHLVRNGGWCGSIE